MLFRAVSGVAIGNVPVERRPLSQKVLRDFGESHGRFHFNTSTQADHPADETIVANQGESYRVILKGEQSERRGVDPDHAVRDHVVVVKLFAEIGATPEFKKSAALPTFPAQTVAADPAGFVLTGLFRFDGGCVTSGVASGRQ